MNLARTAKTRLRKNAKRRDSSKRWLQRQLNDPFVQQARREGYRARSVYKLEEIDRKYSLVRRDMRIVDLGAAPGSWSQMLAKKGARVVALDLLDLQAVEGVSFIRGDFLDSATQRKVMAALGGPADVVLSDIAPDASGRRLVDRLRAEAIGEAVLNFAADHLTAEGKVLLKLIKGAEAGLQKLARERFTRSRLIRPKATREGSSEIYMLAEIPRRKAAVASASQD